jgi:murein DD-endopeptidase MepM/ murein hydrolase activator NlpD
VVAPTPLLAVSEAPSQQPVTIVREPLVSTRTATPSPLPTPVAPKGTPFPQATPTPVPTPIPTPVPTPVPVAFSGWPVAGGSISQYFSAGHPALDISAPCGTAVMAVWSGTVTYGGWKDNGGGFVVDILFDNGLTGSYNHLSAVLVAGGWVPAGTVLGAVGMTGIATGCHLHFALVSGGQYVDPLAYLVP